MLPGVPLGMLFLIFINDLPDDIKSSARLFADYCVLYCTIKSPEYRTILHQDLDILAHWELTWQMEFNPGKCWVMHITRSRTLHLAPYLLSGHHLEVVEETKYLGVILLDMSWTSHISSSCKQDPWPPPPKSAPCTIWPWGKVLPGSCTTQAWVWYYRLGPTQRRGRGQVCTWKGTAQSCSLCHWPIPKPKQRVGHTWPARLGVTRTVQTQGQGNHCLPNPSPARGHPGWSLPRTPHPVR